MSDKIYVDGYLKQNLDIIKNEAIPNNWDFLSIYYGWEGSGKSTKAAQDAIYLDPKFNIKYVVFTANQFNEALETAPYETAILWDEAITGANAAMYAQQISITIVSKLTQIRKKKLKILICFPYLNMLHDYFIKRCLYGINVYAKDFKTRGRFRFYSQPRLEFLYWLMREKYRFNTRIAFSKVLPNFYGSFTKQIPFDEKEYDDKKEWARKNERNENWVWRERFIKTLHIIKNDTELPISHVAKEIGVVKQFLYQIMK